MTQHDASAPHVDPSPEHDDPSPEEVGLVVGATLVEFAEYDDKLDPEDRQFSMRRLWIWMLLLVLAVLGAAAIAAAMVFLDGPVGSAPEVGGAPDTAPLAGPAQAAGAGDHGGCIVPSSALQVASTVTLRDRGVNDPAMFVVQWTSGVINTTREPILVAVRLASSEPGSPSGWEASLSTVAAGEAFVYPTSNFVTNNAGGAAGPTIWRYIDKVMAVRDTPECGAQLADLTTGTAPGSITVPMPRLPSGVTIPAP
ncbi:MAG: hypothetical protein IPO93_10505 [Actinobacteria bacterium]|jgi:hypothetical protein|nr:hypothetical protein [Actinomycetota bacterium]